MQKHYLNYLTEVVSHQWNDTALTDYGEDHEYTFGEMAIEMLRLHLLFEKLGIKRGDKIALAGRNCANWAVAYLAIAAYEGVCVSILQDFTAEDINHLLDHSDSELLFVGPYVWKDLQNQTMPAKLKAALSLADWSPLYVQEGVSVPDKKELDALFKAQYPQGVEPEDISFEDVLKQAQDRGYAERNPEADIEGHDACRKIAILSSLMCGKTVRYEDIPCEGISNISMTDVAYARSMGKAIKLLGISERDWQTGTFYVRTAPYMVPASHPLHGVEDVFNAVFVHGNLVDNLMFYGRGAGKFPTASAVVSDMLDCVLNLGANIPIRWSDEKMELSDPALKSSRFFVRIPVSELDKARQFFRGFEEVTMPGGPEGEAAFTTGSMKESSFEDCARQLSEVRKVIRILEDD